MRKPLLIATLLASTSLGAIALAPRIAPATSPAPAATTAAAYTIDGVHSAVVFRCKHLNTAYAYGMFSKISGSLSFDDASPESSSLSITVETSSVSTGNAKRDGHLKSNDFFASDEFPNATFKSKSFKKTGDNTFDVTGDFTLRGTTKEITVKLEKTGQGKGQGGKELIGFETTFTINRLDYGVKFMEGALGNDVRLTVSIEAGKN
ncbi:MAG: YceI family protein [Phycisphaeraceae bacterium]|nr:YceI family protein [Phycisphaeraceae bacterium]